MARQRVDINDKETLQANGLFSEKDILTGKVKVRRLGGSLGDLRGETIAEQD